MKTKEELNALKEEVETVNRKLHELTDEELAQVTGGAKIILTKDREGAVTAASEVMLEGLTEAERQRVAAKLNQVVDVAAGNSTAVQN